MHPPKRIPSLRDFMRRSRVLSLYRSLLRAAPRHLRGEVAPAFRAHAQERDPAAIALCVAEAERQLDLVRFHAGGARGASGLAGVAKGVAPGEPPAVGAGWPWER